MLFQKGVSLNGFITDQKISCKKSPSKTITKIVDFKLNSKVSDTEFVEIVNSLEANFHSRQSGFIDTELLKGADDRWIIIQHWESIRKAKEVSKLMMKEPSTEEFRKLIDPKSVKILYLDQVKTWGK